MPNLLKMQAISVDEVERDENRLRKQGLIANGDYSGGESEPVPETITLPGA